jgi:Glycosyl transferase family 11
MSSLGNDAFGRFGNKIFAYFFLQMVRAETGLDVRGARWQGHAVFGLPATPLVGGERALLDLRGHVNRDGDPRREIARVASFQGCGMELLELCGFFQYHSSQLAPWRDLFFDTFGFNPNLQQQLTSGLARLGLAGRPLISVHIRRGDYLAAQASPVFWGPSLNALVDALSALMHSSFRDAVVYLCSDDLVFCRQEFERRRIPFISHASLFAELDDASQLSLDFALMARASAMFISNSSLSFAAAMLNRQARVFLRPCPERDRYIPFDPWNSHVLLRKLPLEVEEFVC